MKKSKRADKRLSVLLPAWRKKMQAEGLKYSRQQLLEALIPKAGEQGKKAALLSEALKTSQAGWWWGDCFNFNEIHF